MSLTEQGKQGQTGAGEKTLGADRRSPLARVLGAATPVRAAAARGSWIRDEATPENQQQQRQQQQSALSTERKELSKLCGQLRVDCATHSEQRRAAQDRVADLERERELAVASAREVFTGGKGAPSDSLTPRKAVDVAEVGVAPSPNFDDSPGLTKLQTEARQASQETAEFWQALEAVLPRSLLNALRKKDAAARAAAVVKLERRARNGVWEALQESADASIVTAVAQRINEARQDGSVVPVHVARRLFDPSTPKNRPEGDLLAGFGVATMPSVSTVGSTPRAASRGLPSKRTQLRTASVPCIAAVANQFPTGPGEPYCPIQRKRSATHLEIATTSAPAAAAAAAGAAAATRASDAGTPRVRDRVRVFELSGNRRASFPLA
mmetsp:Transcript_75318/g.148986  ORF Transcript_75318/g.148986 Transcript_75318/m.148986 type:complete len:381 (+) Transcript_75318:48-1190(+)